jgi:hypothetical protein
MDFCWMKLGEMVGLTIIKNGIQWHFMEIPRELTWD